jgi:hypothetical protein
MRVIADRILALAIRGVSVMRQMFEGTSYSLEPPRIGSHELGALPGVVKRKPLVALLLLGM